MARNVCLQSNVEVHAMMGVGLDDPFGPFQQYDSVIIFHHCATAESFLGVVHPSWCVQGGGGHTLQEVTLI